MGGPLRERARRASGRLAARIAGEVTGARDDARQALGAVRDETSSLGARIDELHGLRAADQEAARAGDERLAERIEVVAEIQEDSWEATRAAAQDLSARLEASAAALHAEAADARAAAGELTVRIEDLHDLRTDDLAAAELAGAELAARLDDHAVRSAAEALELERVLRDEVDGIAARLEERDASGIEAREELRGELERVASSVGWRLERIEESLASDQSAELQAKVAELAGRLDEQAALGQEQVRVTERALRKGLASLGERLVDTESAYADAGNALRRSIERLGAAVVEADARMADQVPVSEAEGCVAFAPTPDGYRLVEITGPPPEIGSADRARGVRRPARRHPLRPLAAPTRRPPLRVPRPRAETPGRCRGRCGLERRKRLRPAVGRAAGSFDHRASSALLEVLLLGDRAGDEVARHEHVVVRGVVSCAAPRRSFRPRRRRADP